MAYTFGGHAVLSVDEVTVLIALLHHAETCLAAEPATIARRYSALLWTRVERADDDDIMQRSARLRARATLLEQEVADALDTSQRLVREAQEIKQTARAIRGVFDDVSDLLGDNGDVVIGADDRRLANVREALRLLAA